MSRNVHPLGPHRFSPSDGETRLGRPLKIHVCTYLHITKRLDGPAYVENCLNRHIEYMTELERVERERERDIYTYMSMYGMHM